MSQYLVSRQDSQLRDTLQRVQRFGNGPGPQSPAPDEGTDSGRFRRPFAPGTLLAGVDLGGTTASGILDDLKTLMSARRSASAGGTGSAGR